MESAWVQSLRKQAEAGDSEAQWALGRQYWSARGVDRDRAQAVAWFTRAAKQGNIGAIDGLKIAALNDDREAQYSLAYMFLYGHGVEKNAVTAMTWARRAAEAKDPRAQYYVGLAYYTGEGLEKNYSQAAIWLRKSAEAHHPLAQCFMGVLYQDGHGVLRDDREAIGWFSRAAGQGISFAEVYLGKAYANGRGVRQDYKEAAGWYRRAAERGQAEAQRELASLYETGRGVPQDEQEAVKWFRQAAAQGDKEARDAERRLLAEEALPQPIRRSGDAENASEKLHRFAPPPSTTTGRRNETAFAVAAVLGGVFALFGAMFWAGAAGYDSIASGIGHLFLREGQPDHPPAGTAQIYAWAVVTGIGVSLMAIVTKANGSSVRWLLLAIVGLLVGAALLGGGSGEIGP